MKSHIWVIRALTLLTSAAGTMLLTGPSQGNNILD